MQVQQTMTVKTGIFDTEVESLGPRTVTSTMRYGQFINDDERVVFDFDPERICSQITSGLPPASFERAGPRKKIYFDPANVILYDMGDPIAAVEELAEDIVHVHCKDANYTQTKGDWGEEVVLGTGQVDTEAAGLAIEREFKGRGYGAAGFDLSPDILRLIKAGIIKFTIDQQPYIQGFYPVVQLALYCRYGIRPSSMDAGAGLITRENVDSVMELSKRSYR